MSFTERDNGSDYAPDKRMEWSAASQVSNIASVPSAAPTDAGRYADIREGGLVPTTTRGEDYGREVRYLHCIASRRQ
jgi:hypothetical protein